MKNKQYGFDQLPYDDPDYEPMIQARAAEYEEKTRGWVGLGFIAKTFNPITAMTQQQYVQQFVDQFVQDFADKAVETLIDAEDQLYKRLSAEYEHQLQQELIALQKEQDKQRLVREKEEEKERIARQKEEERQRDIQEAEDARQAEEERWRPRPFEL